jgi:hypothetical protein
MGGLEKNSTKQIVGLPEYLNNNSVFSNPPHVQQAQTTRDQIWKISPVIIQQQEHQQQ